jgi:hypothetical protein
MNNSNFLFESKVSEFIDEYMTIGNNKNLSRYQECTPRKCLICGCLCCHWTMITIGYIEINGERFTKYIHIASHNTDKCRSLLKKLGEIILSHYPMPCIKVDKNISLTDILTKINYPKYGSDIQYESLEFYN